MAQFQIPKATDVLEKAYQINKAVSDIISAINDVKEQSEYSNITLKYDWQPGDIEITHHSVIVKKVKETVNGANAALMPGNFWRFTVVVPPDNFRPSHYEIEMLVNELIRLTSNNPGDSYSLVGNTTSATADKFIELMVEAGWNVMVTSGGGNMNFVIKAK